LDYRAYRNRGRMTDVAVESCISGGSSISGAESFALGGATGGGGGEGIDSGATAGIDARLPARTSAGWKPASTTGPQ
jgi:hypothetical protein